MWRSRFRARAISAAAPRARRSRSAVSSAKAVAAAKSVAASMLGTGFTANGCGAPTRSTPASVISAISTV